MGADLGNFAPSVPAAFRDLVQGRPPAPSLSGETWLALLPQWVAECAQKWNVRADGPVWHGTSALVIPCHRGTESVVLKMSWPHPEARLEHLALQTWDGAGAVRLIAAEPSRWALLLEPLRHDRSLLDIDLFEACEVVGALIKRLGRAAPPRFEKLSDRASRWTELCRTGSALVPRRMSSQAGAMLHDLAADCDGLLVHEDLHFENVLAADREPWLAIDPKPVSGELAYAVAPLLWNRWDEASAAYNVRMHLRFRVGAACDAAEIDEKRALAWSFVRVVVNALEEPAPGKADLSRWITIAKAMTD